MDALQLRDNAREQLAQIKNIETGTDYLNKVKAIEVWAKAERKDAELQNAIAEQKIRTQRILGNLLKENEVSKNIGNRFVDGNSLQPSKKTLPDYGITKNDSSNFQRIASLPEDIFEQEIAVAKQESEKRVELTTSRVLMAAKEYAKKAKIDGAEISKRDKHLIDMLKSGRCVVVNQKTDLATIKYAENNNLFVRADRYSDYGNPFEVGKDGNRDEVCYYYEEYYLPHKKSILDKIHLLKGKALGCWCAPEKCHCDSLKKIIDEKS